MKELQSRECAPRAPGLQALRHLQRMFAKFLQAAEPLARNSAASADATQEAVHARPCMLVVDDNPVNLMFATELLMYFNIEPMLAADGAEAVALAAEWHLDLILMDLQMPVLDGLAATRQIREFELAQRRVRVPVLAYTTSAPALQVLQRWGIDGVLHKPCGHAELQECLQRWCPLQLCAPAGGIKSSSQS
jgi:CheY-like chemotaxis protein